MIEVQSSAWAAPYKVRGQHLVGRVKTANIVHDRSLPWVQGFAKAICVGRHLLWIRQGCGTNKVEKRGGALGRLRAEDAV